MRVEDALSSRFKCAKCGNQVAEVKKLAMTGAGFLDRMMDWQRNRYYFITCTNCGYTEVYSEKVLEGQKGRLGDIIDLIFGS
jgi:hypothetical protein